MGWSSPRDPLDPLKLFNLIIWTTFWVYRAHANMLNSIVSSSHFGKHPVPEKRPLLGAMLAPMLAKVLIIIDDFLGEATRSHTHVSKSDPGL